MASFDKSQPMSELSSIALEALQQKFDRRMRASDLKENQQILFDHSSSRICGRISRFMFCIDLVTGTKLIIITETLISLVTFFELFTFFVFDWPIKFEVNEYVPMERAGVVKMLYSPVTATFVIFMV